MTEENKGVSVPMRLADDWASAMLERFYPHLFSALIGHGGFSEETYQAICRELWIKR